MDRDNIRRLEQVRRSGSRVGSHRNGLRWCRLRIALGIIAAGCACAAAPTAAEDDGNSAVEELFETSIRPLLIDRCQGCHGAKKQFADLRLDTRTSALKGGESGPAVVPGKPQESELLRRIAAANDDERMPPSDDGRRLTNSEVAAITQWIRHGAPWPGSSSAELLDRERAAREHWAFQPLRRPEPPRLDDEDGVQNPIDRFIVQKLRGAGLQPSAEADRRTLIRRATYALLGLPPSAEEVAAFVNDDAPDAYPRLIDRLLDSSHYGEHWGRHWLDVARYSDTKGYVYAREEKRFVHAAHYRDWVVRAFNTDLPYDRFLLLQLAADQVVEPDSESLAAMGLLTLGRRFLGVMPDIVDDRLDVVTRGVMGLTVACARCHDHKYDPIPTADYYSLYGVFANSVERLVPLPRRNGDPAPTADFLEELRKRQHQLAETIAARSAEASALVRERVADYLFAQRELEKYPVDGFDQVLTKKDLHPNIVRRWETYLAAAKDRRHPVFVPWFLFEELPDENFSARSGEVVLALKRFSGGALNPRIARAFADPPATFREVADRYAGVFAEVDRESQSADGAAAPTPADKEILDVLYAAGSPCVIPGEAIVNTESLYDSATVTELWKLQNAVDQWLLGSPQAAPHAVILADRGHSQLPRVFRRGDPARKGEAVPIRFLEVLAGPERRPFTHGSGRLEMARAIVSPENPLTARVWVNRVWGHHFGMGLVSTPSDFGLRADPPSHAELLDWLTSEFIAGGWSTKALHRVIMLSATYRQRSDGPRDPAQQRRLRELDPENRLLSRMNPRRLGYEELRDTLLAASGELDLTVGGPAVDPFPTNAASLRRSIYGRVDRQFVPEVLRVFDFANPNLHTPQRSETTVPQQALFALNHPFVAERARTLAERIAGDSHSEAASRIAHFYQRVFQRDPTERESAAAREFLDAATVDIDEPIAPPSVAAWSYGFGELDASAQRMKGFQPLPYFDGKAWQGGPKWPDAKLGWVQLTAAGGHTGNHLQHAAVRRWTAPADARVTITSTAIHEAAPGDGIRCHIVSSRDGVLATAELHNSRQEMNVTSLHVKSGDTLDFVVDIRGNLNNDQFLWAPTIRLAGAEKTGDLVVTTWDAQKDFAGTSSALLGPWEQLAHVLLMSNELLFVD